jgi:hypothetical protein
MSYVTQDDDYIDGKLTEFRVKLERAVSAFIAEDFRVFQDKVRVRWGDKWQDQILDALEEAVFFIPIITPRFFKSGWCLLELELFVQRKAKLSQQTQGRSPGIILPVYYIDYKPLEDQNHPDRNSLVEAVYENQYVDWRRLRHEPFSAKKVKLKLDEMALRIRDVLEDLRND